MFKDEIMKHLFIVLCLLMLVTANTVNAQADSDNISMNTFMAFNPGGNASLANISMWPNPATGMVNIYINSIRPGDRGEAVIVNTSGTPCIVNNLQNGINKIYFNSIAEGIYFLHIR